jgi:anti-anti-sigma regulatory factor
MTTDDFGSPRCTPSTTSELLEVEVVRDEPGGTVIVVRGELDRVAVPLLAGCLRKVPVVGGPGRTVTLDLAGTDFVDVGGMRLLADATGWAKARDVRLHLTGCDASLLRTMIDSPLTAGGPARPSGRGAHGRFVNLMRQAGRVPVDGQLGSRRDRRLLR